MISSFAAVDTVPPDVFGCPENIVTEIELGSPNPVINWVEPFALDVGEVTVERSHLPGTSFPVATTTVTYQFSDDAVPPNVSPCIFTVQVTTGIIFPFFLYVR